MRRAEDGSATKSGEDRGEEERREENVSLSVRFRTPWLLVEQVASLSNRLGSECSLAEDRVRSRD